MNQNGKLPHDRDFEVLPESVWGPYRGKVIVYSEDEQRVIGVGDTEQEAYEKAKASGVKGLWHWHSARDVDIEIV